MLRKSLYISLSLFLLFFGSTLLFQSCKRCKEKVCNFTFNVSDAYEEDSLNRNTRDGIDTSLTGIHFSYIAFNEPNNPACAWQNFGFNSVYAFTKYCEVLNSIINDSYVISFDRDINFNNTNIPAGTNLVKYSAFKNNWEIENTGESIGGNANILGIIKLDTALSNQILFDTGKYNVTFGFSTDDGQEIRGKLDVVYKL